MIFSLLKIYCIKVILIIGLCLVSVSIMGQEGKGSAAFRRNQIGSGLVNYGFKESVYEQFTGNSIFNGSNMPPSLFTNIYWLQYRLLDSELIRAWSYGVEFFNFSATSNDMYEGFEDVSGPAVTMNLNIYNGCLKAFIFDVEAEMFQPYFGITWGVLNGSFESKVNSSTSASTSFSGLITTNSFGTNIKMKEDWGLTLELRRLTANQTKASNNPFNRPESNGSLILDLSGTMVNLMGYLRF